MFAGAALGVLSYGAFIVAGLAVSILTFSSSPDPWPALLGVLFGCAAFLGFRLLQSFFSSKFGLPGLAEPKRHRRFEDLLDAVPRGGAMTRWFGGVALASIPFSYGARCIVTGTGELGKFIWPNEVHGVAAVALGVGWIGVALFLHFHFFFGLHPTLMKQSRRAKLISASIAGAGLTIAGAWPVFETLIP